MPHTLLLADDSVTIQRVIELTFADEDVTVIAVSDGDQAIARIEAAPPDIILADVGMPGKNGYEVAQYVKQSPRLAHIPVVLLTGAFEPVDQARAAEAGCEGVLAKPFEPQLVIGRVKELLARSGHAAAQPPAPPKAADAFGAPLSDQFFEGTPAAAPAAPGGGADLNNYFDRLDQAFATLASPSAPAQTAPPAPADVDWFKTVETPEAAAPASDQWDIAAPAFAPAATESEATAWPAPAPAFASPPAMDDATARQAPEPVSAAPAKQPAEPAAPVATSSPVQMPPLADAFAALLRAEQGATHPLQRPEWPVSAPAATAITDDVLEEVTRRVLDRLSDRVVHDAVRDVVSSIAERLVRDEIERIKASIR